MTITLNGQNIMHFLSRDSSFFYLEPGENYIALTFASAGAAKIF